MSDLRNSPHYISGAVFRLWATYWLEARPVVPPVQRVRYGLLGEVYLATPLTDDELADFFSAMEQDREVAFGSAPSWVLDASRFFGDWRVFSAKPKR